MIQETKLPAAYIVLPGEQLQTRTLSSQIVSKVKTAKRDFNILQNQDNIDNPSLQAKHSGWLWNKEGEGELRIALFGNPLQYFAEKDDFVIARISGKTSENYFCDIGTGSSYVLNSLDFEGATKKNRPNLLVGCLVYARVVETTNHLRGKLSCINPNSKKEWVKCHQKLKVTGESLFGELKEGYLIDVALYFCEQLLSKQKKPQLFKTLSKYITFEVCIGKNGKIWINPEKEEHIVLLANLIKKAQTMSEIEQLKFVQQYQEMFK